MQKKALISLVIILLLVTICGCAAPCKVMSIFNVCPHERPYLVYGRVVDNQSGAIENCKVILIKRKYPLSRCKDAEIKDLGQYHVALTDKTGDYSFCFEPLEANDVWLYFDAKENGYIPQFIELNHLMGPTFLQTPGNSPLIVDMLLEKVM